MGWVFVFRFLNDMERVGYRVGDDYVYSDFLVVFFVE